MHIYIYIKEDFGVSEIVANVIVGVFRILALVAEVMPPNSAQHPSPQGPMYKMIGCWVLVKIIGQGLGKHMSVDREVCNSRCYRKTAVQNVEHHHPHALPNFTP